MNRIIDLWADQATTDQGEKVELARLDELQETFYARALEGDVQYGALVTKIIERRSVMLGLDTPQTAVLQIVNEAAQETSTDKIERALNALLEDQGKKNDPTTISHPQPISAAISFSRLSTARAPAVAGSRAGWQAYTAPPRASRWGRTSPRPPAGPDLHQTLRQHAAETAACSEAKVKDRAGLAHGLAPAGP